MEVRYSVFTPTTMIVAGPTGSGKTELVFRMLGEGGVFDHPPSEIRYHYGAWQKRFEDVEGADKRYVFVEGIPGPDDLPSGSHHTVMVIDDLMEEASKSKTAMDIFTKHSHHQNMSVIFLVQKLYGKTHHMRVISQNAHILVLFKNPRDTLSIQALGRQMFPSSKGFLTESYIDATQEPHSYLVVNAHQKTDERLRVVGNLFDSETPTVYIPRVGRRIA